MTKDRQLAEDLARSGIAVVPEYFSLNLLDQLRAEIVALEGKDGFRRAGVGSGSTRKVQDEIRRDSIHWLDRSHPTPVQTRVWEAMEQLRLVLNQHLFLGILEIEAHYAVYPAGGFYSRHVDSFRNDDSRIVSFVLYLNSQWMPMNGGQLRVYEKETFLDVEPRHGTLVCFLSRECEHEVLLSHAPRYSFTGWFKTSPQSVTARGRRDAD